MGLLGVFIFPLHAQTVDEAVDEALKANSTISEELSKFFGELSKPELVDLEEKRRVAAQVNSILLPIPPPAPQPEALIGNEPKESLMVRAGNVPAIYESPKQHPVFEENPGHDDRPGNPHEEPRGKKDGESH